MVDQDVQTKVFDCVAKFVNAHKVSVRDFYLALVPNEDELVMLVDEKTYSNVCEHASKTLSTHSHVISDDPYDHTATFLAETQITIPDFYLALGLPETAYRKDGEISREFFKILNSTMALRN